MKEIIISIKPEDILKIAGRQKTIELRKTAPAESLVPFKAYIYASTSGTCRLYLDRSKDPLSKVCLTTNCGHRDEAAKNYSLEIVSGKVIGEFICDRLITVACTTDDVIDYSTNESIRDALCLTRDEVAEYIGDRHVVKGWHISDLVIYDHPMEISNFRKECWNSCWDGCEHYCGKDEDCKRPVLGRNPQNWMFVERIEER